MTSPIGRRLTSPNFCLSSTDDDRRQNDPLNDDAMCCRHVSSLLHRRLKEDDDDDNNNNNSSRIVIMSFITSDTCNVLDLFSKAVLGDHDKAFGVRLSIAFCIGIILLSFVTSTITRNYSQVDKAWSIVPVLYAWFVVRDERTLLMAVLATIWGARLTWNFNRRGGYSWPPWSGDEDYRWKYLQDGFFIPCLKNSVIWVIFNLVFISFYQHVLLWLIASPSVVASLVSSSCGRVPLNIVDVFATIIFLCAILIESIADNQQYKFQTEKHRKKTAGLELTGEYMDGFKQSGLFGIVRKPNYAAEQLVWITFYTFSIAATKDYQLWNWSATGFILLCALFQGSGWFTENITISKYPKYKEYQKATPLYLPNPLQLFGKHKVE